MPKLNFNISIEDLYELRKALVKGYSNSEQQIFLNNETKTKNILEKAFIIHKIKDSKIVFNKAMNVIYFNIFKLDNEEDLMYDQEDDVFSYF